MGSKKTFPRCVQVGSLKDANLGDTVLCVDFNTGLTSKHAAQLHETEGLNQLTPPKEKPEWVKLLETQKGFFNILLWFGAILCFIGYALQQSVDNLYLGIVLSFVVTVTGIFEYFQERNASSLMKSFANMLPPGMFF